MNTLKGMMSGGSTASVLNFFNQKNSNDVTNHPVTQNISTNLITTLMNKFGLNSNQAAGIAGSLIPMAMSKLVSKTNDSNDSNDSSFNLQGIYNSLNDNKTGGMDIGSLVSKFGRSSLDKNNDGQVNLADLTAAFTSNNSQTNEQNPQQGGGGIMDSLKVCLGNIN